MVTKIIDKMMDKHVNDFSYGSKLREEPIEDKYHVRQLYDKFVVCYNNRPMSGLSMNSLDHAQQIANIMNKDMIGLV